jgi:hypothetical protein
VSVRLSVRRRKKKERNVNNTEINAAKVSTGRPTTTTSISEAERICQAYVRMAHEARYRPAAPSDGWGSIQLSAEELNDPHILDAEAREYAERFIREENRRQFYIGCSKWSTNRALVFTIEAARALCECADEHALRLLRMATDEVTKAKKR